jgi:hypothetical protein
VVWWRLARFAPPTRRQVSAICAAISCYGAPVTPQKGNAPGEHAKWDPNGAAEPPRREQPESPGQPGQPGSARAEVDPENEPSAKAARVGAQGSRRPANSRARCPCRAGAEVSKVGGRGARHRSASNAAQRFGWSTGTGGYRDSAKDRIQSMKAGARSYITKPFKVRALLSAVARASRRASAIR